MTSDVTPGGNACPGMKGAVPRVQLLFVAGPDYGLRITTKPAAVDSGGRGSTCSGESPGMKGAFYIADGGHQARSTRLSPDGHERPGCQVRRPRVLRLVGVAPVGWEGG